MVIVQSSPQEESWKDLKQSFKSSAEIPKFSNANIVNYFVNRTLIDGRPAGDFKSMNASAENLFCCGHVQQIEINSSVQSTLWIRASCLPEMKKDRIYKLKLALNSQCDVIVAECGCPAGKAPHGSCKHIGALCYALAEFCKLGITPQFLTCTDRLQSWNKPRARKLYPIPVDELGSRRKELMKRNVSQQSSLVVFDPRPLALRQENHKRVEQLHCTLLNFTQPAGFLSILLPSVSKIQHDHTYSAPFDAAASELETACRSEKGGMTEVLKSPYNEEFALLAEAEINRLCLSRDDRITLELETRNQCGRGWHDARRKRITGSKCGRVIEQKKRTVPLLRFCVYPRPLLIEPRSIMWGRRNESVALTKYIQYMNSHGHPGLSAVKCGFYVHPEKGWLGASPDATVCDPAFQPPNGLAEFKCPFSKAEADIDTACKDEQFYCTMTDSTLHVKRSHCYYHQVQLQLFTLCSAWCDFCVYTTKSIAVERIYPDLEWQKDKVCILDSYFFDCILPELIFPTHKPSYFL